MKKFVLLSFLMSAVLSASAQWWVTIPDPNFAAKLNQLYPDCMDGNQMNIECPGIVNAPWIDLASEGINDLSGIEYFVNLEALDCSFNDLTFLPELPQLLVHLDCESNNITQLPQLPQSLQTLNCGYNSLSQLPELPPSLLSLYCDYNSLAQLPQLPQSLLSLICYYNSLTQLPELPASLDDLWCHNNSISELPELPTTLHKLYCGNNNLSELPVLPISLVKLYCQENNLSELPELPVSLEELYCSNNNLSELPELPISLVDLSCGNNILDDLPELPTNLQLLRCEDNNLTSLPELPANIDKLECNGNELTCLPPLPEAIVHHYNFDISDNPLTCLPNYIPAMSGDNEYLLDFPLCVLSDLENNPYGCSSFEGIAGTVFEDGNGNCLEGLTENGVVNASIKLFDEDDNLLASAFTFGSNNKTVYNLAADTGNYSVQLITESMSFQASCDDPGDAIELTLTASDPAATDVNFGVECIPGFDLGAQQVVPTGWVFPGQDHVLNISAGDLSSWFGLQCAAGVSGSVTVNISGPVGYVEPAENAMVASLADEIQLTYEIDDFGDVNFEESFGVILETDTTAQAGDLVCVEVIVDPIDGDANPENNVYTHCYEVVNSYDPNIKQVWPQNVEPGFDGYFNYTIYFQNTGTAPAFNVRVADTLDTNLDLSTFQVTGYSHDCLTYVEGNVATFRFNNFMLPDSTSDFEGSIGYVQYRIKPLADLPVGTVIENTAHIYFDFNEAIVTNTTQNEYVITTSANQPEQQLATVFPNPGTGQFNVLFRGVENGLITHLEIYNLNGQRVLQRQVNENRVALDLTDYPSGMYLLHVRNERGSEAVKLLKQ